MSRRFNANPHLLCSLAIFSGTYSITLDRPKKPFCHDVHFIAYFKLVFDCFVVVLLFVFLFLTKVSVTLSRGFKLSFHVTLLTVIGAKVCTGSISTPWLQP